jgi:transcriptional regulator with XRE-family HTH domain
MSKNKTPTLSDVFRKAIAESGLTLYRIAKDTGIVKTSLMRFMAGDTSLRLDRADALAAYLGLRLVPDPDAVLPEPTPENRARPMLAKRKRKRKAN